MFLFTLLILSGKEDGAAWDNYVKEVDDWLSSSDSNKGVALFKELELKIIDIKNNKKSNFKPIFMKK